MNCIKTVFSVLSKCCEFCTYLMDYFRCTGVLNKVQVQETVSPVHFIIINSMQLKRAIIEHCCIWKDELAKLLLQLTCNMIKDSYHYTCKSTEKYERWNIVYYMRHGIINNEVLHRMWCCTSYILYSETYRTGNWCKGECLWYIAYINVEFARSNWENLSWYLSKCWFFSLTFLEFSNNHFCFVQ